MRRVRSEPHLASGGHADLIGFSATAAGPVPVFAKLTPNVTDIVQIAAAAQRGGAAG